MSLCDRLPKRNPLRTRPHRIGCDFDIPTVDILAVMGEDRRADPESRVRAVGRGFCSSTARVERIELGAGDGVILAGLCDMRRFAGGEELHGYGNVGDDGGVDRREVVINCLSRAGSRRNPLLGGGRPVRGGHDVRSAIILS